MMRNMHRSTRIPYAIISTYRWRRCAKKEKKWIRPDNPNIRKQFTIFLALTHGLCVLPTWSVCSQKPGAQSYDRTTPMWSSVKFSRVILVPASGGLSTHAAEGRVGWSAALARMMTAVFPRHCGYDWANIVMSVCLVIHYPNTHTRIYTVHKHPIQTNAYEIDLPL